MPGYVCLSFDFDAISIWLQRNLTTMTSISRGEYGAVVVPRILHLLRTKEIKSTWFIPGHTMETYPALCEEIINDGHEIGLHGYAHENFNQIDAEEERSIMNRTIEIAEKLTGTKPKGFRSPSWDISGRTIDNLQKLGFSYDSSLMGHDFALYNCRAGDSFSKSEPYSFGSDSGVIEMPISWTLDDYPHYEYVRLQNTIMQGLNSPGDLFSNWSGDLDYMLRDFEEGVITVTLHPQASGRGHRFLAFERWLDSLAGKEIQFCRMDQVAAMFGDGKRFGLYKPQG